MPIETKTKKVLGRLVSDGWVFDRHGAQHDVYKHPTIPAVIALPRHRTLSPGVARQIAKTAGWI